ncbi:MAG TPA: peptidoglycan-associated lipoprotein Pal [Candidatus Hydrogenedentes bacterium]|jgi:peptidoglycan-associated lipoprotein|nr:MAG: Outer membrane lipoprotein Omp16 precursor [Candidatus Hydrogenedentes bacterium ADurb.Bin170]HNZ47940.1 peptidoglycan-associated lipoprotein Pal [Candidatus Hydrogenedentota bacterium]HOD95441.1 peptidoglycan-associated lipoprotein Pal [Candidatus Hydrogenedentota bacterium]HOM46885.1 peptidoglycan-associated lipoprotein Pal [Candidatus Hydrogenedentota bacterium]HOR50864.1 peptidoglycan-associated lipoprotein Pal [Candidatus Hydrogenedentota bacterium]
MIPVHPAQNDTTQPPYRAKIGENESMVKFSKLMTVSLALLLVVGMMAGCQRKKPLDTFTNLDDQSGLGSERTTGDGLPGMDLESLLFEPGSKYGLQTVYFDYNSDALRGDAMDTLRSNAEKIKQVPGVVIQIAGHCDERGTQEYNMALGERRALAVRQYLIQLGVSGDRIVTISYGKEFPAAVGSNEAAWSKNRRAEFNRAR